MSTEQALAGVAKLIISRHRIYSDFGLTLTQPAQLLFIKVHTVQDDLGGLCDLERECEVGAIIG